MSKLTDHIAAMMSAKTDQELNVYIDNRERYLPETVETALTELDSRGAKFSDEELDVIQQDMIARRDLATDDPGQSIFSTSGWKYKSVDDEFAPRFFSQQAITIFTIFLGTFFGSIMLAINVFKTESRSNTYSLVFYGLMFEIGQVLLFPFTLIGLLLILITRIIAAFAMTSLLWNRYIGSPTLYKPRPVWVPLIIAIALMALNFYYMDVATKALLKK